MWRKLIVLFLAGIFSVNAYAELMDPTQPTKPTESNFEGGGMELNAILYSSIKPIAIIGGNVVQANDMVDGYRVTEIQKQSVTLTSSKGEVVTLQIDHLDVKKPHQL